MHRCTIGDGNSWHVTQKTHIARSPRNLNLGFHVSPTIPIWVCLEMGHQNCPLKWENNYFQTTPNKIVESHIHNIYIYIPSYPHSWMIFPLYPQDSDIGVVSHWQRTTFQQALVTITAAPAKMEKSLFAISHVSTVYHITGMTMNDYESPVGYIIHIHSHSSYSIYHHITIE